MSGIIICGGNGSGKTTLGRELAKELQYKHMDIEDYYFLDAPLELRLKRIKHRAYDKFGDRVLEGGDMYEQELRFFNAVEKHWGEKIEKTKAWLKTLSCPVIYLDGTKPIEENIRILCENRK